MEPEPIDNPEPIKLDKINFKDLDYSDSDFSENEKKKEQ